MHRRLDDPPLHKAQRLQRVSTRPNRHTNNLDARVDKVERVQRPLVMRRRDPDADYRPIGSRDAHRRLIRGSRPGRDDDGLGAGTPRHLRDEGHQLLVEGVAVRLGALLETEVLLAGADVDGEHSEPHGARILYCESAHAAAGARDGHPLAGHSAAGLERFIRGDAPAEYGSSELVGHAALVGQDEDVPTRHDTVLCEAAVNLAARVGLLYTPRLALGDAAVLAPAAVVAHPADAHEIPQLDGGRVDTVPDLDDPADALVAQDLAGWADVACRKRQVGPAYARG